MNILGPFVASGLVYLLPFLIGSGLVVLWHAIRNHRMCFSDLFFAPVIGSLGIFAFAAITYFPSTLIGKSFLWANAIPVILWIAAIFSMLGILFPFRNKVFPLLKAHLLSGVALVFLSATISFLIWTWRSPYPLNWDMYEHQTLVNAVRLGKFSFSTGQISDTFGFGSYPPFFHVLLSSAQHKLVNTPEDIASFWQWSGFWQAVAVGLASYSLTFAIARRRLTASLAVVLGTLIFDSTIAFTSLFLLPQNVCAVFATFVMAKLAYDWQVRRHTSVVLFAISLIALILSHYVIGSVAAALLFFWWFCLRFTDVIDDLAQKYPLVETFLIGGIAFNVGASAVNLSFINKGEGGDYIFSAASVSQFLFKSYGNSWLLLLPLAIKKYFQQRSYLWTLSFFVFLSFIMVLTAPLPYMFKFFVLGRFWLILWLSIGLATLFGYLRTSLFRMAGVAVVIAGLAMLLMANTMEWKRQLAFQERWVHFQEDDLAVATYLKNKYSPQTLIVSDPSTQYILEGLSGLNSPGGAFENTEKRDLLANALLANEPEQLAQAIRQTEDGLVPASQKLFVFSGRTWQWMSMNQGSRNSFSVNVWAPAHQSWLAGIYAQKLINSQQFSLVFQTPSIWVFSLK